MMELSGNKMQVKAFHLSAQGASHIKRNKECQDASFSCCGEDYALAVVCDGHGGDDYVRSASGAAYACQAAAECMMKFLRDMDKSAFMTLEKEREEQIFQLEASIINAWNTSVSRHYADHPFTPEEEAILSPRARKRYLEEKKIESAYGTTMIVVVLTRDYWLGLQVGDGRCVVVDRDGDFSQPIPWNEKCFLNVTTSICDSDAIDNFRHCYSSVLPAAVLIGSDGVDDCFSNEAQLNQLYKTVLYSFANSSFEDAMKELDDYLPRLSEKGSGDDVSISAILDMDAIKQLEAVNGYAASIPSGETSLEQTAILQEPTAAAEQTESQDQTEVLTNEQQDE